jgi:hypothetical protein
MENVSLSIISLRSRNESAIAANQTWLNIKPDFQRDYESWNDKLKTRLIESIILGRAMNPIWTIRNDADESEEVLDGMHRLTTALKFLENEFAISSHLTTLSVEKYKDKKFNDLMPEDKHKIRSYNFIINKLDSSYKNDPEKLQDMYEILNRSSKTLNTYEFAKPLLQPFYELIANSSKKFLQTVLFENDTSSRGKLETEITKILALCEDRLPDSFSSINDIYMKWQKEYLGETPASISGCISTKGDKYIETLERVKKVMDKYTEENLFPLESNRRKHSVPIMIIITRTVALIKSNAVFSRHSANLINSFKSQIIDGDIQQKLECASRNASFQKKVIELVDKIIRTEIGETEEPRLFSKKMILDKLEEQKHMCAICGEKINTLQKYEGDHIQPWICGGRTIVENLQVVHHKCHKRK